MSEVLEGQIVPAGTPLQPDRPVVVGIFLGGPRHGEVITLQRDEQRIAIAHLSPVDWLAAPGPDEAVSFEQSYYRREEFAWGFKRRLRVYVHESLGIVQNPPVEDAVMALLFDTIIAPKYQAARTA